MSKISIFRVEGREAKAAVVTRGDDGPVSLVIGPLGKSLALTAEDLSVHRSRANVSAARVIAAAGRVLTHDAISNRAVDRGRSVRIDLSLNATPAARVRAPLVHTEEECRSARPRLREMLTPHFLPQVTTVSLKPYQRTGAAWLLRHPKALLADDMGLGKTIQAIYAAAKMISSGRVKGAIVVAPNTLLSNWQEEFARWAPSLCSVRLRPRGKERDAVWKAALGRYHVIVINYEQLRSVVPSMAACRDHLIIADEAHRLRNADAQVTAGMRELAPETMWALTGTPIERDAEDLATLLAILMPHRFSLQDKNLSPTALRSQAEPYILRRKKSEVLSDLPDVIEQIELVELSSAQAIRYEKVLARPASAESAQALKQLSRLRQTCDADPSTGESSKVDRAAEIIGDIADLGEKVIVFSFTRRPLELLEDRLKALSTIWLRRLDGRVSPVEREKALAAFRAHPGAAALLLSAQIGGEGLTLTAANHVIFVNQWWNPSKNAQARDRVVRIGQEKGVSVYYLICKDTVEEYVQQILVRKRVTIDEIVEQISHAMRLSPEEARTIQGYIRRH